MHFCEINTNFTRNISRVSSLLNMQASRSIISSHSAKQTPKWGRGMSFSLESPDPKPSKSFDRKPSIKSPSSQEKRAQEQLLQLQEELKKAKEEIEELKRNKATPLPVNLEKEVEKAKESERKMLESLIAQTKQFEQTKISLEEARLEIKSLRHNIECLEGGKSIGIKGLVKSQSDRNLVKIHDPFEFDVIRVKEQIGIVTKELKLATAAEENSKKAMDGLALALKEVSTEANQAKARLSTSQTELERVKSESERTRSMLRVTEEKLQSAVEETKRLKSEAEDSTTTWNEKEKVFKDCMKISEEEIANLKQENAKLTDSLRISREDYSKLRDILKHAVNEANVVKETLEIARSENSKLQDLLSEKESAYQSIRQEYECLKVSEAAAVDSVKELKGFLAATSNMDYSINSPVREAKENEIVEKLAPGQSEANENKVIDKLPPSDQKGRELRMQNGMRRSIGGSERFMGSLYDPNGPSMESSGQVFGTMSNISDYRIPSSVYTYDMERSNSDELNDIDRSPSRENMHSSVELKKKKPMFKRFGDMLRRKSFRK